MLYGPRDDHLEVNSESELDEDDDMSYDDLTMFCQNLLEKYNLLKVENKWLKKENDFILKEKDSSENKFEIVSKENKLLKNQVV